jgi:chromosome segregation ATPase
MIEPAMFFGIGFLAACLIALVILPLVHARAVRLTARRVQAAAPVSIAEIQADKDQLRAEFAMSTRRLEMSVEQLKEKTTGQLSDLGKKTEAIIRLKAELAEKAAAIAALETRQNVLHDQLRISEEELGLKANALQDAERKLKDRENKFSTLGMDFEEKSFTTDSQRIEIVALRTQVATLRDQVANLEREVTQGEERLARERATFGTASRELEEERGKAEALTARAAQLERSLAAKTAEAESLSTRFGELETLFVTQEREFGNATRERDQLQLDLDAVRRIEQQLRDELAGLDGRHRSATESLRSAKSALEDQLERARDERAKMQDELSTLKRQTESSWESERMENALLRERINDVSAEVARLMVTLEGADSPIEAILAEDVSTSPESNGHDGTASSSQNGAPSMALPRNASLADRIRALQSRSRVSAN